MKINAYAATAAEQPLEPFTYEIHDLAPDDSRFIMLRLGGGEQNAGGGQLVVVEHWLQEMRAKVEEGQR